MGEVYQSGGVVRAWADGFGVWHVRVSRTAASSLIAARRALRDELEARGTVHRSVWMHPVRVPALDDETTIVYQEGGSNPLARTPDYVITYRAALDNYDITRTWAYGTGEHYPADERTP